jgi:selenide,water dikinase
MIKGGLRPGDALILTKPLGTGTLFAALPQGKARGRWIQNALHHMQISNRTGAAILAQHGAKACTDLTGFGLLGHLVEMTKPSGVDVQLNLEAIPLLDGAEDCVRAGVFSSLQPANVRLRRAIRNPEAFLDSPRYALLFDPQTAGGLLASVPGNEATACIAGLHEAGYEQAAVIGLVLAEGDALEPVTLSA